LLFFGTFGAHRFYLDRPVSGVLYFLTAGFAGIGIVYDIFAMPFLVASANQ
jgi:TM2 domain-containing membrane protein YozV